MGMFFGGSRDRKRLLTQIRTDNVVRGDSRVVLPVKVAVLLSEDSIGEHLKASPMPLIFPQ